MEQSKEYYFAASRWFNLDDEDIDHDIYKELFVNRVEYDDCYVEPMYEFIIKHIKENKYVIKEIINTAMVKPDTIIHLDYKDPNKPHYKIYDVNPEMVSSHATLLIPISEYHELKNKYNFFKSLNDNKMSIYKVISNIKKKYNLNYNDFIELSK